MNVATTERSRLLRAQHGWQQIIDGLENLRKAQGYLDTEQAHWLDVAKWELKKTETALGWKDEDSSIL